MGYVGASLVLRWYVSGTQLFSVYSVPVAAQAFNIEWQRANLDQTVAFFETLGAVRSNKQP